VPVLGHVARERDHLGVPRQLGGRGGQLVGAARIDDQRPAEPGQLSGEGEAEASGGSGDDRDRHVSSRYCIRVSHLLRAIRR
jgi:hypothetical protein